ncbi:MAG TPA: O-methyltransferase [Baekduia sp.]|nr:O-methyltransferase [Baekduia sp.]
MIVDHAVEAYAEAHTTAEPEHLAALAAETRATLELPQMLTGPVVGRLLETLVWLRRPRLVVEIGTYSGYSALAMAAGLPAEGRIITLDISEEHAAVARRHIAAAGEQDRIEVRVGPALDALAALDGPYDMVFIDADKTGYEDYLEAVLPKLAPDGLIVADNTLREGRVLEPEDDGTRAIARFNDLVAQDPRVVAVVLTVRDGVTLIRPAAA